MGVAYGLETEISVVGSRLCRRQAENRTEQNRTGKLLGAAERSRDKVDIGYGRLPYQYDDHDDK